MIPSASAFVGLVCLAILGAGIRWQIHLRERCSLLKIYEIRNRWGRYRGLLEILKEMISKPYFQIREFLSISSEIRQDKKKIVRMGLPMEGRLMRPEEEKILAGIAEKRKTIPPMREKIRISAAASISICLVIGSFAFSIFQIIDPNAPVSVVTSLVIFCAMTIFSLLFFLKTFFGPIILSGAASWALYFWFQHGSLEIIPIFNLTIEIFLSWAPDWFADVYLYTYILYSAVSLTWSEWGFAPSWLTSLFGDS